MLDHFLSELQATAKAVAYAEKLHLRRSAIASIAGQVMTPLGVSH